MIFSVHNKYKGGFDYYETGDTVAINDDHPTPRFSKETKLGVAATRAARGLPVGAMPVGHGELPVGSISSGVQANGSRTGGGSILPSGLGSFSLPTPSRNEWAIIGALIGAIVHGIAPRHGSFVTTRAVALTGLGAALAVYFGSRQDRVPVAGVEPLRSRWSLPRN